MYFVQFIQKPSVRKFGETDWTCLKLMMIWPADLRPVCGLPGLFDLPLVPWAGCRLLDPGSVAFFLGAGEARKGTSHATQLSTVGLWLGATSTWNARLRSLSDASFSHLFGKKRLACMDVSRVDVGRDAVLQAIYSFFLGLAGVIPNSRLK
jgi:hypothetical protein